MTASPGAPPRNGDPGIRLRSVRAMVDTLPDPVFMKDVDGRYTYVNDAAARILGRRPEDIIGRDDGEFFSPETAKTIRAQDLVVLASSAGMNYEEDGEVAGRRYRFLSTKAPMRAPDGTLLGLVGISRDVTGIERLRSEAVEADRRARALADAAFDAVVIHERGVILDANVAAEQMIGAPPGSLRGRLAREFVEPDHADAVHAAAMSDAPAEYTATFRRADGSTFDAEVRSRPSTWEGRAVRIVMARDVTQRRQAEESLRRAKQYLDAVGQAIAGSDLDRRVLYWNPAAVRIYGHTAEEIVGRTIEEAIVTKLGDHEIAEIYQHLLAGVPWTGELMAQHKSGRWFPARATFSPVRDDHGDLVGLVGVSDDLTKERAAKVALEESAGKLVEAQAIAQLGSYELDLAAQKLEWSAEMGRIFGAPSNAAPDAHVLAPCIGPDDYARAEKAFEALVAHGIPLELEMWISRLSDGTKRYVRALGRLVHDEAGRPAQVRGTVQDITEQHEARVALEQARANAAERERLTALGTLVAGVAHEINNPLSYMQGSVEIARYDLEDLARMPDLPEAARAKVVHALEAHGPLLRGVERVAHITKSLRQVSRESTSQRQQVLLAPLLEDVLVVAHSRIPPTVSVQLAVDADARAWANATELSQVFLNLVLNAAEAMADRPSGILTLRAAAQDADHLVVEVADTGPGIPRDAQDRIFTPFFTTKAQGTGLGLPVSRRIVENHGGTLTFRTSPSGTTFAVTLPTRPNSSPAPRA